MQLWLERLELRCEVPASTPGEDLVFIFEDREVSVDRISHFTYAVRRPGQPFTCVRIQFIEHLVVWQHAHRFAVWWHESLGKLLKIIDSFRSVGVPLIRALASGLAFLVRHICNSRGTYVR